MSHPYDSGRNRAGGPAGRPPQPPDRDAWVDRPRTEWPDNPPDTGGRRRLVVLVASAAAVLVGVGAVLGLTRGEEATPVTPVAAAATPSPLTELPGKAVVITPRPQTPAPSRTKKTAAPSPRASGQPVRPVRAAPARTRAPEPGPTRQPTRKPTAKPTAKPTKKPTKRASAPAATRAPKPPTTASDRSASAPPPQQEPTRQPPPPEEPPGGRPQPTCDNWVDCNDLPPGS
jgi:eukaryotic-like serine/threonine-protein kinase